VRMHRTMKRLKATIEKLKWIEKSSPVEHNPQARKW
jgi:hypothetical protein